MYENLEAKVALPEDPNVKIWRYMDFAKFVAMLEDDGLFFSRADKLGDPFEGSTTPFTLQLAQNIFEAYFGEVVEARLQTLSRLAETFRAWVTINCWHMNNDESFAMWKIYGRFNEGIAIQSTYARLRECLDPEVVVGVVRYMDYEKGSIDRSAFFSEFLHKRLQFKYEQELRAIFFDRKKMEESSPPGQGFHEPPPFEGICIAVDLDRLIEKIYVAPSAPIWFADLAKKISVKYGFDESIVHQSSLDASPQYF